jgi:outer membrane lipoprotein SlyB
MPFCVIEKSNTLEMRVDPTACGRKNGLILISGLLMLLAGGCASNSPDVMSSSEVRRVSYADRGVVVAARPVTLTTPSAWGLVVGAMAGAELTKPNLGKDRDDYPRNRLGSRQALGTIAGAAVGHGVATMLSREDGVELIVQLQSGRDIVVVQGEGTDQFAPGDPVSVVSVEGRARVVRLHRDAWRSSN